MAGLLPGFLLGYHGCDESVAESVLAGEDTLRPSTNDYDWLGNGIYFWESNPRRALDYATQLSHLRRGKSRIATPAVVGAVIDPGSCLDLLNAESIAVVREVHARLVKLAENSGFSLPVNSSGGSKTDMLLRPLDCAVMEMLHRLGRSGDLPSFDTVRAVFVEGAPLYEGSGFHALSHIQVCVRNPSCIVGVFRVRLDS
jgi:hypothetical protein